MRRRSEQSTFYRNRLSNLLVTATMGVAALYFLTEMVGALEDTARPSAVAIDAVFMVAFLVPAVRFPLNGVITNSAGIVVRNILRTHLLHWDEVEHFEIASDFVPKGGVVVLSNGKRIPMTGINQGLVGHFVAETIAALNEQLGRERCRPWPGQSPGELGEERRTGEAEPSGRAS